MYQFIKGLNKMFKRISNSIKTSFQGETLAERSGRILPGALYGAIAATAYSITLTTINVISYPGLNLAIDWSRVLTYWIGFGLALALAGAIAGWFTESYMGIIGGGVVITALVLIGNLIVSIVSSSGAGMAAQSIITTLPLIGAGILLAAALRFTINRHTTIQQEKKPSVRGKQMAGLIAIVIVVGWIPGFLSRFDKSTVNVIKAMNDGLTSAATDPTQQLRFSLPKIPGLKNHFGMNYRLYPRPSTLSTGSLELTVRFQDGYSFTCITPTEGSTQVYFTDCNEGNVINSH